MSDKDVSASNESTDVVSAKWYFKRGWWTLVSASFFILYAVGTIMSAYNAIPMALDMKDLLDLEFTSIIWWLPPLALIWFWPLSLVAHIPCFFYIVAHIPIHLQNKKPFRAIGIVIFAYLIASALVFSGAQTLGWLIRKHPCAAFDMKLDYPGLAESCRNRSQSIIDADSRKERPSEINSIENETLTLLQTNSSEFTNESIAFVTPFVWEQLSPTQQRLYFYGILETFTFIQYGKLPRNENAAQLFSDLQACISNLESKQIDLWPVVFNQHVQSSIAKLYIETQMSADCEKFKGTGNLKWNPYKMTKNSEWSDFSESDLGVYLAAYIDTAHYFLSREGNKKDTNRLSKCVKKQGIDRLIKALREIEFDEKSTLPWSIATAVGDVCEP